MTSPILLSAILLSLTAGAAFADSVTDNPPKSTTICLNDNGRAVRATCQYQASRLDAREDICICPALTRQVKAPVCAPGVNPPPTTVAFERERLKAVSDGSLMAATWHGQPMCVLPRTSVHY